MLNILEGFSVGTYILCNNLCKLCIDDITSPICHIINTSIEKNIFPNQWKIFRISPIPKIKSPKEPSDFRPISILPILSKVYERLFMNQMVGFLETEQLLSQNQSGFRKGHWTTTCLLYTSPSPRDRG